MEGLRLVSRQFRKQRLAVWAAGRGPDSHFTAMVFWLCETVSNVWQYGLRARSVLHCHGVLALRDRPLTWKV